MAKERTIPELIALLKIRYREHATIERLFYPDRPLPIEQYYLHLALEEKVINTQKVKDNQSDTSKESQAHFLHNYEYIQYSQRKLNPEELLDNLSTPKKIYIEGAAGAGKTTLTQFIAYQWSKDHPAWKDYDFLFRIRLRDLTASNYPEQKIDFIELLEKECFKFGFDGSLTKDEKYELEQYLTRENKKVLFILDGYDELSLESNAIETLWKKLIASGFNFIITSRPGMQKIDLKIQLNVAVLGFSDEQIKKYIYNFFDPKHTPNVNREDASHSLQTFRQNINLWSLAHTPIQLELLCSVWEDEIKQMPDIMLTQLYHLLFEKMLKRCEQKQLEQKKNKQVNIHNIKMKNILDKYAIYIKYLEYLAYLGMKKKAIVLSETLDNEAYEVIDPSLEDSDKFYNQLEKLGFIKRDGKQTEFLHLTFQEYFAARYIANCFKDPKALSTYPSLKEMIAKRKYHQHYEIVWRFVAGLLKDEHNRLEEFFNYLQAEPYDLAKIYQFNLQLRCLAECEIKIEQHTKNKILNQLKAWIEQPNELDFRILTIPDRIIKEEPIAETITNILKNKKQFLKHITFPSNLPITIQKKLVEILKENDIDGANYHAARILSDQRLLLPGILQQLTELLKDPAKNHHAAIALSGQKELPDDTVLVLSELLKNNRPQIDELGALLKNTKLPELILQQLVELLNKNDTKKDAAQVLYHQPGLPSSILYMLCEQLSNNITQKYAAEALSGLQKPPESCLKVLIELLNNKETRIYAKRALFNQIQLPASIFEVLCEKLNNNTTQKYAAEALSGQKQLPKNILETLYKSINDSITREYAAIALSKQTELPETVLQQLIELLSNEKTQRYAVEALSKQTELPESILQKMLKLLSAKSAYRCTAIALLGEKQLPKFIIDELEELLKSEETKLSAAMILLNQKKLKAPIIQTLGKLLNDRKIIISSLDIDAFMQLITFPEYRLNRLIFGFAKIHDNKYEDGYLDRIIFPLNSFQASSLYAYLSCHQNDEISSILLTIILRECLNQKLNFYFYENTLYIGDEAQGEFSYSCQNHIKKVFSQIIQKELGFNIELNKSVSYDNKTTFIEDSDYRDQPIFIGTSSDNYSENLYLPDSNTNPTQENYYNFNININNCCALILYVGGFIFIVFIAIQLYNKFYCRRSSITQNNHSIVIDSIDEVNREGNSMAQEHSLAVQSANQQVDASLFLSKCEKYIKEINDIQGAIKVLIKDPTLMQESSAILEQQLSNVADVQKLYASHSQNEFIITECHNRFYNSLTSLKYYAQMLEQKSDISVDELNRVKNYFNTLAEDFSAPIELHPYHVTEEQEVQAQALFFSQRYVQHALQNKQSLGDDLLSVLHQIKAKLAGNTLSCFISYAWPIDKTNSPDRFIQPFLEVLRQHLMEAGIYILLDFKCIEAGQNLEAYMKNLITCNHWLLVGTPSLTHKLEQHAYIEFELKMEKIRKPNPIQHIYPLIPIIVLGDPEQSLPHPKLTDKHLNFSQGSYLSALKRLLKEISHIPDVQYNPLWAAFETKYMTFMKPMDIALAKKYMQGERQAEKEEQERISKEQEESYGQLFSLPKPSTLSSISTSYSQPSNTNTLVTAVQSLGTFAASPSSRGNNQLEVKKARIVVSMSSHLAQSTFAESIKEKIKQGTNANPDYKLLLEYLVDPRYKEHVEFLKEEMRSIRSGTSNADAQAYLGWLEKNYGKVGDIANSGSFEDKAIDLYIRDELDNEQEETTSSRPVAKK